MLSFLSSRFLIACCPQIAPILSCNVLSKVSLKFTILLDPVIRSAPELPAEVKATNQIQSGGSIALICNGQASPTPLYRWGEQFYPHLDEAALSLGKIVWYYKIWIHYYLISSYKKCNTQQLYSPMTLGNIVFCWFVFLCFFLLSADCELAYVSLFVPCFYFHFILSCCLCCVCAQRLWEGQLPIFPAAMSTLRWLWNCSGPPLWFVRLKRHLLLSTGRISNFFWHGEWHLN